MADSDQMTASYDHLNEDPEDLSEEDRMFLGIAERDDLTDVTNDPMAAAENAAPYLAPTDPPVIPGGRDAIEVAQGFASTSEDAEAEEEDAGAEEETMPADDDTITDQVRHLLRTDAETSSLELTVETIDGVVYLRGAVSSLDDGDLAAEVAARVPGVVEVVDETTVTTSPPYRE
jgi:BON domain